MALTTSIPSQIAGYSVLPLSLPPLPSFPTPATHYLYVAQHQPKIPTATASRSLFLVNVPFDATETHIKGLFSQQLELPAGRVEDVQFEGQRRKAGGQNEVSTAGDKTEKKGKKRKRGSDGGKIEAIDGAALPSTWDRDLQSNGLTAVVMFVDRVSMDTALKALKRVRKEKKIPVWGKGVKADVPALGSASTFDHLIPRPNAYSCSERIPEPPAPYVSRQVSAP